MVKSPTPVFVTCGVLQGSILGPLLFSMFINNLLSILSSPIFLFADYTKIFHILRNKEDHIALQNDLNYIYMYHFHISDQRKASVRISHIALSQNVNEIYALLQWVYLIKAVRMSHYTLP